MLAGRYEVIRHLGGGGFAITFLARDMMQPSKPLCVVKQLRPTRTHPRAIQFFHKEAVILEKLGKHPQIPQLLAHFKEGNNLYIVQEFIGGRNLTNEISPGKGLSEGDVHYLLQDILEVLSFVHKYGVIHRDIKPQNLIRRQDDGKIVLIDFGVVKELGNLMVNSRGEVFSSVIVGTPGYMPKEQSLGKACLASDVYAVGMTAITALTGLKPSRLENNPKTGEVIWLQHAQVSEELAKIITKMVRRHFSLRYSCAQDALKALNQIVRLSPTSEQRTPTTTPSPQLEQRTPTTTPNPQPEQRTPTPTPNPQPEQRTPTPTPNPQPEQRTPTPTPPSKLEQRTPTTTPNPQPKSITPIPTPPSKPKSITPKSTPTPKPKSITSTPQRTKQKPPVLSPPGHFSRRRMIQILASTGGSFLITVLGQKLFQDDPNEVLIVDTSGNIIHRQALSAKYFTEYLGNSVTLEMAEIPGGKFLMGSPANESGGDEHEHPQHKVTVKPFLMGKFAVTQAQYELIIGKNPSRFKGKQRPVERVSWNDATEFCKKLTDKTGRTYRLPSEAEWEYACRALTLTPFHFGETITTDLVNYNGSKYTYANAPKGRYRQETTKVGIFPPNAFGLYDMHGNVYEWCQDLWHHNYNGAPDDGSAWLQNSNDPRRLMRGGSWRYYPELCRSAKRYYNKPEAKFSHYGFRVVCSDLSWTGQ